MTFVKNWNFSEKYIPAITEIIKKNSMIVVNIKIASNLDDKQHATDLQVEVSGGNIAVRIRRGKYAYRDLTIRSYYKGYKTELEKLRDGHGDWYLYAWEDAIDDRICEYVLIDLALARTLLFTNLEEKTNRDGSKFVIITLDQLREYGAIKAHEML